MYIILCVLAVLGRKCTGEVGDICDIVKIASIAMQKIA